MNTIFEMDTDWKLIGKYFFSLEMRCKVKYLGFVRNNDKSIYVFWDGNMARILDLDKVEECRDEAKEELESQ